MREEPQAHGMTREEAQRRLDELREKEKRGELTVQEAGEITKMMVILGEIQEKREAA